MTAVAGVFAVAMGIILLGYLLVWVDERLDARGDREDAVTVCLTCNRVIGDDEAAAAHRRLAHLPRQQSPWDAL